MGLTYCGYVAQLAKLPYKLSVFPPAQKETPGPDKWIEVAISSASSFYLFSTGQYFSIPAPNSAAALFHYPGHYQTWLIVVQCYRGLTVFCLFSHQWGKVNPTWKKWLCMNVISNRIRMLFQPKPTHSTCSFQVCILWGQRKCASNNWEVFGIIQIWIQIPTTSLFTCPSHQLLNSSDVITSTTNTPPKTYRLKIWWVAQ